MQKLNAVRGMPTVIHPAAKSRRSVEERLIKIVTHFGYREMRPPIIERTELFRRSIGEATDIVEKEMYEFADKKGTAICLRPEATAGLMRAGIELELFNRSQKLWCLGPMFRYERPQSGRLRQFDQLDVEAVGFSSPAVDAELIWLSACIWDELGISPKLKINALGSSLTRQKYDKQLKSFLHDNLDKLDEHSRKRIETAPLRILDSKNPDTQKMLLAAPQIKDCWDNETEEHFEELLAILDKLGIKFEEDNRLVRGLDYYDKMVFEWLSHDLGAQNTLCAGGRYNGLIKQLGGQDTPAVGFALGMERLIIILAEKQQVEQDNQTHILVLPLETTKPEIWNLLQELRKNPGDLLVECDFSPASLKSKLKNADKLGVDYVVILGEEEIAKQEATLRDMQSGKQESVAFTNLAKYLNQV